MMIRLTFILIFFQVMLNFNNLIPTFNRNLMLLRHPDQSIPGQEFIPLKPSLTGIMTLGYQTCIPSQHQMIDPEIMGPYQEAQFVLSPVILDYNNVSHEVLLYRCQNSADRVRWMNQFLSIKVLYQDQQLLLIRKQGGA